MYQLLLQTVVTLYKNSGLKNATAEQKAKENLLWEGNKETTVKNFLLLGTFHRPDMVLNFDENFSVAIEIKKGESGYGIREGIDQSIVYATKLRFRYISVY